MQISKLCKIVKYLTPVSDRVHRHSKILSILLVTIIWSLLILRLVRDWQSLPPGFFSNMNYVLLLASLGALILALLLVSLRWGLTLRAIHVSIDWWRSVQIWFLSQLGRYLPGGIWSYVGRFYLGRSEMSQESVVVSMALETGLRVVSEILVFLISLPFWGNVSFVNTRMIIVLVGGVGLGLLLLHPMTFECISKIYLLQQWLDVKPLNLSQLRYRHILSLLCYYILMVLVVGGAFFLLVGALYPLPIYQFPALTGSLAASMVLGFLIPLTPNGWGIREGVLAFLLSHMMPFSVAVVVSITTRVWLMLGEGILVLIILSLQRVFRGDNPKELLT
jgi:glycosyltransferase 2 family protein